LAGVTVTRQTVLLTRPRAEAQALARRLRRAGHKVLLAPLSAPLWLKPSLPEAVDALVLTSARAAHAMAGDCARFAGLPVYAIGPATAAAARRAGLAVAEHASGDRARLVDIVAHGQAGKQVLYACGDPLSGDLAGDLQSRGVQATALTVYQMVPVQQPPRTALAALKRREVDVVLLLSAQAARSFAAMVDAQAISRSGLSLACLSPTIGQAAGDGWRQIIAVPEPDLAKLLTVAGLLCDKDDKRQKSGSA
jgi:uroporphyrinogen-III synthase